MPDYLWTNLAAIIFGLAVGVILAFVYDTYYK